MINKISTTQKAFEITGFFLGWLSVIAQFVLIILNREAEILETVVRYFSFFTILTNILVALFFTAKIFKCFGNHFEILNKKTTFIAITTFIFVVGLVYQVVLRAIWKPTGVQFLVNELLHSVIPVLFLIYWFLFSPKEKIKIKEVILWLLYPLFYLGFVLSRGLMSNFYPYPFLNISEIGIAQVLINSVLVTVVILFVMGILVVINNQKSKINKFKIMKTTKIISVFALLLILGSCMTMKKSTDSAIYGNTWELEYLSGPRIAFAGLYPDKKPTITFNETTKMVEGNNSCNGYSAEYVMTGNQISFKDPGMTTMMFCGEGEKFFLSTIKKVNSYKIDADGKLNLMIGEVPMMRFKKVN